jgi:hypothetical protein
MFNPGNRVNRIEDRPVTGATIISVQEGSAPDEPPSLELAYDEGGTGWWPSDCVEPVDEA